MPNIRVDTSYTVKDGSEVVFTAPCNCNEADGLKVYYPDGSKEFAFTDAHGNVLTGIGELFVAGALVKVILDVTNGFAYVQNADTNAYLEAKFDSKAPAGYIDSFYEAENDRELDNALLSACSLLAQNTQERCVIDITSHPVLYSHEMDTISSYAPSGWSRPSKAQNALGSKIVTAEDGRKYYQMKRTGEEGAAISWVAYTNMVDGALVSFAPGTTLKYRLMIDNGDLTGWEVVIPAFANDPKQRPLSLSVNTYNLVVHKKVIAKLSPGVWYDIKLTVTEDVWLLYINNRLILRTAPEAGYQPIPYINMGVTHACGNGKDVSICVDSLVVCDQTKTSNTQPGACCLPNGQWVFEVTKASGGTQVVGHGGNATAYRTKDNADGSEFSNWILVDAAQVASKEYVDTKPTIYSGHGAPDDSLGKDGDIYIQFEE